MEDFDGMVETADGEWMRYEDHAARIRELEAQLVAAQDRNTKLQSEHIDHVNSLYARIDVLRRELQRATVAENE